MKVENAGQLVPAIHTTQRRLEESVRKYAKIPAPAARQSIAEQLHGRARDFEQFADAGPERMARRVPHPVDVVADGKNTRVVLESGVDHNIERPQRRLG